MTLNQCKEQFSKAYAIGVASVAACSYKPDIVDDDSVDLTLKSRKEGTVRTKPEINIQLKATAQDVVKNDHIAFPLKIKNYNDLRDDKCLVPRILVILIMPVEQKHWFFQQAKRTHMFRCAYWMSLRGMPAVEDQDSVTVRIPLSQMFTPDALNGMMDRISEGHYP